MRNTGVRTLFSVVISQGGRFSEAAWDEALWDILFPLVQSIHQMAATSSKAEVHAYSAAEPQIAALHCRICMCSRLQPCLSGCEAVILHCSWIDWILCI